MTQVLEDIQKVLSLNIGDEDEVVLDKFAKDLAALRRILGRVSSDPGGTFEGRLHFPKFLFAVQNVNFINIVGTVGWENSLCKG